jgi:hypothetical protein
VTGQRTWISTCRARTMTAYAPINDAIARHLAVQMAMCRSKRRGASGSLSLGLVWF